MTGANCYTWPAEAARLKISVRGSQGAGAPRPSTGAEALRLPAIRPPHMPCTAPQYRLHTTHTHAQTPLPTPPKSQVPIAPAVIPQHRRLRRASQRFMAQGATPCYWWLVLLVVACWQGLRSHPQAHCLSNQSSSLAAMRFPACPSTARWCADRRGGRPQHRQTHRRRGWLGCHATAAAMVHGCFLKCTQHDPSRAIWATSSREPSHTSSPGCLSRRSRGASASVSVPASARAWGRCHRCRAAAARASWSARRSACAQASGWGCGRAQGRGTCGAGCRVWGSKGW